MPGRYPHALGHIVEQMAKLSPPRHRELVRGMVAELDSIAGPVERRRLALGAIAAIVRLALIGYSRAARHAAVRFFGIGEEEGGAERGGRSISELTARQLLRRHAIPFAVSLASLTSLLLAQPAARQVPELSARGVPAGGIVEVLLLTLPLTLALTVPAAVFMAYRGYSRVWARQV